MSNPLTVIAFIRAKAGMEQRVRDVLVGLTGPTRREAGCLNYDLFQSESDPRQFVFYENWESAAHLDAHGQSAHIRAFRALGPEILDGEVEISRWRGVDVA
jgi:quinol monooxygenase YgiN